MANTNPGCSSAAKILQIFGQTRKGRIRGRRANDADDYPATTQARCDDRNLPPMFPSMLRSEDKTPLPPCHISSALQQALNDPWYHEVLVKP
jgi:hypothetical protein